MSGVETFGIVVDVAMVLMLAAILVYVLRRS